MLNVVSKSELYSKLKEKCVLQVNAIKDNESANSSAIEHNLNALIELCDKHLRIADKHYECNDHNLNDSHNQLNGNDAINGNIAVIFNIIIDNINYFNFHFVN